MQKKIFSYILWMTVFSLTLTGCKSTADLSKDTKSQQTSVREYSVQSVLWQQNAAEYRALCYQAFNVAKLNLDQFMADESLKDQNIAIITDIDETVLDNSPFNAKLIEKDEEYSVEEWTHWTSLAVAEEVPGAGEFLNYAKNKGVEIFYVTNRRTAEMEATLENMKAVNFPFADEDHVFLREETGSKKDRFDKVLKDHTVVMYLGDNLGDFSHEFITPSTKKRNDLVKRLKENFGVNFIVLPNPMYGDWEMQGIYEGKYDWTDKEKDSIRKAKLRAY
ncbi:MAG TPA: 5'-nucleotidase, lipoprotein e(P4) family [Flavobacteriaceae bacterium]|nr:5'-nucleotidase, lipoprotein e(P4) family [Flavobacteriaceae bacterium]